MDAVLSMKLRHDLMNYVSRIRFGDNVMERRSGVRRLQEVERPEERGGAAVARGDPQVQVDGVLRQVIGQRKVRSSQNRTPTPGQGEPPG